MEDAYLKSGRLEEVRVIFKPQRKVADLVKIHGSTDVEKFLRSIWNDAMEYQESFVIVCTNRANNIIGWKEISRGTDSGCIVCVKTIAQLVINTHSSGFIMAHNHPSGSLRPSESDVSMTKKVKEAMKLFDIALLDHIILTHESHFSFADEGML